MGQSFGQLIAITGKLIGCGYEPNSEAVSEFALSSFATRLETLIGGKRQISAFARKCGLGDTTIRQYLDGATPRLDKVVQIAEATGTSIKWLATGDGPRDSSEEPLHVANRTQQEQTPAMISVPPASLAGAQNLVLLPRLAVEASAGRGIIPQSESVMGFMAFQESYLREIGINPRFAHILQVSGDSMSPTLSDKDWVVVDTSIDKVVEDAIYAVVYAGAVRVKRLQMLRNGGVILSSDNKAAGYVDERLEAPDLPELHVVGRVKSHFRTM